MSVVMAGAEVSWRTLGEAPPKGPWSQLSIHAVNLSLVGFTREVSFLVCGRFIARTDADKEKSQLQARLRHEFLEHAREQVLHVAIDFCLRQLPAGIQQIAIF